VIDFSVEHDVKKLTRHLSRLQNQTIEKATVSALNKVARSVKTASHREISKQTGIPQGKFSKSIVISKASKFKLSAAVIALPSRAFNLIEFVTKGKRKIGGFRKKIGVTAKAWGKKKEYKGTFIGTGKTSGKFLVYARTSDKARPIKAIHGPHIPTSFLNKIVMRTMKAKVKERFGLEMDRALIHHSKGELK